MTLLSTEVAEPKGASTQVYLSSVVRVVRSVQAEVILAATQELRKIVEGR